MSDCQVRTRTFYCTFAHSCIALTCTYLHCTCTCTAVFKSCCWAQFPVDRLFICPFTTFWRRGLNCFGHDYHSRCTWRILHDMLRDRLVCGLRDMKLQRRLLAEPSLTFKKAFELTQAAEVAERSTKELQAGKGVPNQSPDTDVLAVGPWRQQQQQAEKCYRCGGNHRATGCRFRTADCHNCGKKGHLARAARPRTR